MDGDGPRIVVVGTSGAGKSHLAARVLRRTARRTLLREPLWHGNRETLRMALFSRESILWWSLSTFAGKRRRYEALMAGGEPPHLRWQRLRRPREAQPCIDALHVRLAAGSAPAARPPAAAAAS